KLKDNHYFLYRLLYAWFAYHRQRNRFIGFTDNQDPFQLLLNTLTHLCERFYTNSSDAGIPRALLPSHWEAASSQLVLPPCPQALAGFNLLNEFFGSVDEK